MALRHPFLAMCANRSSKAKTHPRGGPEDWLIPSVLRRHGLFGVSFDFFVQWSGDSGSIGPEIWMKRITDKQVPASLSAQDVQTYRSELISLGDDLEEFSLFADAARFEARYMIFRDGISWATAPERIAQIPLVSGHLTNGTALTLAQLAARIQSLSGGPVWVGSKGLTYGTSTLECHLACNQQLCAAWPGDADMVLCESSTGRPVAILEFKKDTMGGAMASQSFQNFYSKDRRKFTRLGLLRDYLGLEDLIFVAYPAGPQPEIKLEKIRGHAQQLRLVKDAVIPIGNKNGAGLAEDILAFI
jgi:hypothetical protein